ncbi:MAG: LiaF-related protein [Acidimicrobiia bacterium]|nr:LiaF-related protein [Acidimicrobiia bacterium]
MSNDIFSPEDTRRPVAAGPLIWGAILIVIGVLWLLASLGVAAIPWRAALAAVLILVGIGMLVTAGSGSSPEGLFTAGTVLAVILALLSTANAAFSLPLAGGIGDRSISPTIDSLEAEYRLVAGQLDIDLSDVVFPEGETELEVSVTFGQISIDGIPDDVAVSIESRVTAGEALLLGTRWDGVGIEQTKTEPGFDTAPRRLLIDARAGFGQIEVSR